MAKKSPAPKKNPPTIAEQIKAEVSAQLPRVQTGIAVAVPSTTSDKMNAICSLADAIKSLADALKSTNLNVHIQGCSVSNAKCGIHINGSDNAAITNVKANSCG